MFSKFRFELELGSKKQHIKRFPWAKRFPIPSTGLLYLCLNNQIICHDDGVRSSPQYEIKDSTSGLWLRSVLNAQYITKQKSYQM